MANVTDNKALITNRTVWWRRMMSDYGMIVILAALCVLFSLLTIKDQYPTGADAAENVWEQLEDRLTAGARLIVVTQDGKADSEFTEALNVRLEGAASTLLPAVSG